MSEKPEALRLADILFAQAHRDDASDIDDFRYRAAAELRRLHAENERLREALTYDWDQLEACRESLREHMVEIKRLREALDNLISACELPGDHCEVEQALPHAKAALRREYV